MTINILVVDDDKDIRRGVRIYLEREGYQVHEAENGQAALDVLKATNTDVQLVIMDVMMPVMDGNLAAMQMRAKGYKMPIIMLSAKSEAADKIEGLTVGADDYVTKPFHAMELMAHVKAQLRRYLDLGPANNGQTPPNDHQLVVRGLVLDQEAKQVTIDGRPVKMTPKEFQITELLMKHPGRVYSVDEIYEYVWNEPSFAAENTVAVHIRKIREKIEVNPKQPEYLKVVWGVGYKLEKLGIHTMKKIWENLKVFMKREWWIALLTTLFMVSTVVAVASINGKYGSPDDREAATYYYIPESGGYDGDSLFANRYLTTYADAIKKITISPKDVTDEQVQTFINGLPSLADRLSAIDDRYKYQDMYNDRTMTKKEYDSLIDQQVALDKASQDQKATVVRKLLADEATRSIRQIAQDRLDDNDAQYLDTNYSYYLSGEFGAITDIAQLKIQKKPTAIEAKVDGASETRVYDVNATYRLTDYNAANEIFYGVDDTIDPNGIIGALINEKTTFDVTGYVGLNGQLAQSFNTETTNYKRLVSIMVPALTIAILSFLALTIILFARPLVAEEIELLEVLPIDIRFVLGVIFTIFAAIDAFWLAKIIVSFGSYLPVSLIVIGLVAIAGLLAGFILYTLLRNLWGIIRRAPGHTRFMGQVKNSIIARFGKWAYGLIKKIPAKYFFVQMAIEMIAVALVGFVLLIPVYSHFLQFLIIVGVLVAWGFIIKKHLSQITGIISSVDHLLKSNKIDTAGAVSVTDTLEKVGQIDSFVQDTKARDAQAQALKTELITNVSHDLRSPLTSIITYGDLLAQDDLSEEDRKDYVAVVNQKAARMKQLIDDLFEVVKMDNGEVALQTSSLDFVAFVKQVVSENSDLFDHAKLSLVSKYPDNEIAMSIDAGQMQRVVINLLENASKYSLDGTRVFLKLEEINHQVLLEIKNTSKHPLDEDADTLLERFKRGDSSRNSEGSGLGLAIVDSIVRLHKGSFQVAIDGDVFIARVILNQ